MIARPYRPNFQLFVLGYRKKGSQKIQKPNEPQNWTKTDPNCLTGKMDSCCYIIWELRQFLNITAPGKKFDHKHQITENCWITRFCRRMTYRENTWSQFEKKSQKMTHFASLLDSLNRFQANLLGHCTKNNKKHLKNAKISTVFKTPFIITFRKVFKSATRVKETVIKVFQQIFLKKWFFWEQLSVRKISNWQNGSNFFLFFRKKYSPENRFALKKASSQKLESLIKVIQKSRKLMT